MTNYLWLLIPLAALLGYATRGYQIYRFQNRGEELLRNTIIKQLPSSSWHLLNNVTLKTVDGTTQIDHILVSRFGVFVIETKHYTGWLFGDAKSKQWTQVIYGTKHRFQNPLHQNYKHLKAVQELLDFLSPEQIIGLVVFTGDAEFKTDIPLGVYSLGTALPYLKGLNEEVLTENRMQFCVGRLECHRLALTQETDVEHQENLSRR
jgi:restriction system protein